MSRPSFRVVATALALACLPLVSAHEARAAALHPTAPVIALRGNAYTWCLQDYGAGATDCSFSDRSQCEATAAGGLGECVRAAPGALYRD